MGQLTHEAMSGILEGPQNPKRPDIFDWQIVYSIL